MSAVVDLVVVFAGSACVELSSLCFVQHDGVGPSRFGSRGERALRVFAVADDLPAELIREQERVCFRIGVSDDPNAEDAVDVEHVAPFLVDGFVPLGLAHESKVCRKSVISPSACSARRATRSGRRSCRDG